MCTEHRTDKGKAMTMNLEFCYYLEVNKDNRRENDKSTIWAHIYHAVKIFLSMESLGSRKKYGQFIDDIYFLLISTIIIRLFIF